MNAIRPTENSAAREDIATLGSMLAWGRERLRAANSGSRLDVEVLLANASGQTRAAVIAFPERQIANAVATEFRASVERRAGGEPLAYIVGNREFYSLELGVSPAVLVPRPETELLVDTVLELVGVSSIKRVLDVGTGSGAIALALKANRPAIEVTAIDVSQAALEVAEENARRLDLDVEWRQSDWLEAVAGERFDLIVSNPPYIRTDDPHMAALQHEPRLALDGGVDGLHAVRSLLRAAPASLEAGGCIVIEHGYDQLDSVSAIAASCGLVVRSSRLDLAGLPRVSIIDPA